MTNAYIITIAIVLLIILFIILLKVRLIISYDKGLLIYLKILWFERIVVPSNDKNDKKRTHKISRDDDWALLGLYSHRVDILDLIRDFWKRLYFEKISLFASLGGKDATEVALYHSLATQAVYYILAFLDNTCTLSAENTSIALVPDFLSNEKNVRGSVVISARFIPAMFLIYRIRRLVLVIKGENYDRSNKAKRDN